MIKYLKKIVSTCNIMVAKAFVSFTFLLATPSIARAADLQVRADIGQTGGIAGPLNTTGDAFCPSNNTPGCDLSDTDRRIRTHDIVTYGISVQVDAPGDDVTLEIVLKPGLVFQDLPVECDAGSSSIIGDGSNTSPSSLTCALGFQSSWAAEIQIAARVLGDQPNGGTVGLQSVVLDGPNSVASSAAIITDLAVTATPRLDIALITNRAVPAEHNGQNGGLAVYGVFVGLRQGAGGEDPLLGNETVTAPLTFTFDISDDVPTAYIRNCRIPINSSALPFTQFNPSFPERSVLDTGTINCSSTGPSATGSTTVTLTGADLSFENIPTQTTFGTPLPQTGLAYATFGEINVFVPPDEIAAAGGTLTVTDDEIVGFNPIGISGQPNFAGQGEDTANNIDGYTMKSGKASISHTKRCFQPGTSAPPWCTGPAHGAPTNATRVRGGDGTAEPSQTFSILQFYSNKAFFDDGQVDVCTVVDSRYIEALKFNGNDSAACHGNCGTRDSDHIIEYGTGYVSTAFLDAASTPLNAIPDECSAPPSNWHSSFDAAQAVGPITKIRMRRLNPLPAGTNFNIYSNWAARDTPDLVGVPSGTLLKSWGTARSTQDNYADFPDFRPCGYTTGTATTPHSGCGDRLILARGEARIEKTTLPNDNVSFIGAGSSVGFQLAPRVTSIAGTASAPVVIVDTLPVGAEYVTGSAEQDGSSFEPIVTGNIGSGQTLTWDLGTVTSNTPIPPITFRMSTPSTTATGTVLSNTARIDTSADPSLAARRSDTRSVRVSAPTSMTIGKVVSMGGVENDQPIGFTVEYANSTNDTFNLVDIIDIFPYVGDNRFPPSDFRGTVGLGPLVAPSNQSQFYVAKTIQSGLSDDPKAAANNLTNGLAKWCPLGTTNMLDPSAVPTSGGNRTDCPSSPTEVTALRMVDTASLAAGARRTYSLELTLLGNRGSDIYTNQVRGTADRITLSPTSPYASTTIQGQAMLQANKIVAAWNPDNEDYYYLPGNEVLYTITIENLGKGPVDPDSLFLVDNLPPELEFWNGDINSGAPNAFPGSSPIGFVATGAPDLTFDPATDLAFSTTNTAPNTFADCTFIPADGNFRADIRHICLNPKGELADGSTSPTIAFSFRAKIK